MSLGNAILLTLKQNLGAWTGGWVFTIAFVVFWWLVLHVAYRRRIFLKMWPSLTAFAFISIL